MSEQIVSLPKNDGKDFEALLENVMAALGRFQKVRNSKIEKNIFLDAKTLKRDGMPFQHQIDLCWDFELDGVQKRVVFQAKDMARPIDRPLLMTFCAVLNDLVGDPSGIIVTKTGFDGPVIEYAEARGIGTYILNEAGDDDFVSNIPSIELTVTHYQQPWQPVNLVAFYPSSLSDEDLEEAKTAFIQATSGPLENVLIKNGTDIDVGNLQQLAESIYNAQGSLSLGSPVCLLFPINPLNPLFVCTSHSQFSRVQLASVCLQVERQEILQRKIERTTVTHLLQFVTNDQWIYIDTDFVVHSAQGPLFKNYEYEFEFGENEIAKLAVQVRVPIRGIPRKRRRTRSSRKKR